MTDAPKCKERKLKTCLMPKFRRWFLVDGDRLVKIKSLRPHWDNGMLWWPSLLIDSGGGRSSITLGWNWARVTAPFRSDYVGIKDKFGLGTGNASHTHSSKTSTR